MKLKISAVVITTVISNIIPATLPMANALSGKAKKSLIEAEVEKKSVTSLKTDQTNLSMSEEQISKLSSDQSYKTFIEKNQQLVNAFAESKKDKPNLKAALENIKKWNPSTPTMQSYKEYFIAIWSNQFEDVQQLYLKLKKEKKFIRLRLELIAYLLKADIKNLKFAEATQFVQTESRLLIKQLRGSSEGEVFESAYLKWLQKNSFFDEICNTERSRWIGETKIEFVELVAATEKCQVKFDDFTTRLRRLLFAAKDYQALREIELYSTYAKLQEWEKAYLKAIFDSHSGDPISGFKNLSKYENEILKTDYKDNYFYIAQRAGELDKAEAIIKKILSQVKGSEYQEMKFQQGFLLYQTQKYKQAHAIFDDLYKNNPYHKRKTKRKASKDFDQLAWLRAWTLYLDGQYDKALKAFEETVPFVLDEARLAYWVADTKAKLGDDAGSISGFRKLANPILDQKSFSYYNLLAWLRYEELKKQFQSNDVLKSIALVAKMNKGQFPVASDNLSYSEIMASYSFYDKDAFATDEGDIQVVNTENEVIQNFESSGIEMDSQSEVSTQINWAKFLIIQNESDLARWHLYEIEKKANTRSKADALTRFYLDQKFYYRALSLMNRFYQSQKVPLSLKADPLLWEALYPEAYRDQVFKFAEARRIDPYLILSIMRAETQYKSDAISPVGAVGLMQFMPYSAQKVADLLNQKIETEELFAPERSIEFGAAYLKKLWLEMESQKPLVAASYNGGPHRVKVWLKNFGNNEFDKFIEHIPFAETRTYVKRVLTFRATYDRLYSKSLSTEKYGYLLKTVPVKSSGTLSLKEEWEPFRGRLDIKL